MESSAPATRARLGADAVEIDDQGTAFLIGGRCSACGAEMFPAAPVCSACMSEDIVRVRMPRKGTLYAFSTVHVAPKKWRLPMTIGYVDLPNGARVFTHLAGNDLAIGDTVEVGIGVVGADRDGSIETFVFRKTT